MTAEDALKFASENHNAVLVTHRSDGGVQTSPITVGVDDERIVISSRETAYKVRNLRRDPRATICVFTNRFYGDWMQIEGTTEIVSLPEAMEGLAQGGGPPRASPGPLVDAAVEQVGRYWPDVRR